MHDWHDTLVTPDVSIEAVLRVIDRAALRLALVIDHERKLLGTITDGDIRRALIARVPLSQSVQTIMNANPKKAAADTSREQLLAMMQDNDLLQIPLVDADGKVVGIETLRDLLGPRKKDNWVFLMAGGVGKRLSPLTDTCPKPMLIVGGKPILETILESFLSAGFHRFYISVHYLPDTVKNHFGDGSRWGATIRYIEESVPLGTAGALRLLPTVDDMSLLMMNGDLLTKANCVELLRYHASSAASLTMCVREYDMQVPFGVVEADGHQIIDIVEKPVHRFFVNAGIYALSPEALAFVSQEGALDMPVFARRLIGAGRKVAMFPIHESWLDIGRMDDFERAQAEYFK